MLVIKGNNKENLTELELKELLVKYKNTYIDLGTGDGRFVYKNAKRDSSSLYIGIDPSQKQLEIYAKKSNKDKLENTLFVVGSAEQVPTELYDVANVVHVNFPWGTLLKAVVEPNENLENIGKLLKRDGKIEIVFGYSKESEPSEYERLQLTNLSIDKIEQAFRNSQWEVTELTEISKESAKQIESTWGKKLAFGKERPLVKMVLKWQGPND